MLKPLTVCITADCGEFLERWEHQTTWPALRETCMQVRKQRLEPDMKQWTGSKLRKQYIKAVYCHPAYSTSVQISVQFSRSVVSDSLWPHGLQHVSPPCPSPTPRAFSNSCPLSWWSHPIVSSSVVPFFSCRQSLPASGSFPMSQFHQVAKVLDFQLQHQFFMWNAGLDESRGRIKIAGRNTNSLKYADTTLVAESEQQLKCLLMRVKEESEKTGINLNIKKTKIMASGSIISCQIDGGKKWNQ